MFLPVLLVLLGLGNAPKIALIAIIVFFQILVTARDAAKAVPEASVLSVRSLGASRLDIYRHVVVPAALPDIFTALRIGTGTAIAVLFLAESIAGIERHRLLHRRRVGHDRLPRDVRRDHRHGAARRGALRGARRGRGGSDALAASGTAGLARRAPPRSGLVRLQPHRSRRPRAARVVLRPRYQEGFRSREA